jgi:hypothetical protein
VSLLDNLINFPILTYMITDMTEEQKDLQAALLSDLEYYGCELDQAKCAVDEDPSPKNLLKLTHLEDLVWQIEEAIQRI